MTAGRTELAKADLESLAREYSQKLFPGTELKLESIREGRILTYISLQQIFEGLEVIGAKLVLSLDAKGDWNQARSSLVANDILQAMKPATQEAEYSNQIPATATVVKERRVIYPQVDNDKTEMIRARELQIQSSSSDLAYLLYVSLETGMPIGVFNPQNHFSSVGTLSGTIYPNFIETPAERVALPFAQMSVGDKVMTADAEGKFAIDGLVGQNAVIKLKNPFLSVINNAGEDNALKVKIAEGDQNFDMDLGSLIDERNIYHWVMASRDFLEKKLNFKEMNFLIVAMARDGMEMDNAYFNPLMKQFGAPVLAFGTGKNFLKNTSLHRDVIIHEFGHAVTWQIYGNKGGYEFSAMNEAFSDYLAATITDNPQIGEGVMMKLPFLRTVENEYSYPKSYKGFTFHDDGQLFSGALWDLRKKLGADAADILIHEARLAQADSINEFKSALMNLDDLADPNRDDKWATLSPNFNNIRKAFLRHGLNSLVKFDQNSREDITLKWINQNGPTSSTNSSNLGACWTPSDEIFSNVNP